MQGCLTASADLNSEAGEGWEQGSLLPAQAPGEQGDQRKHSGWGHGPVDGDNGGCVIFLDFQTCSKVPSFINAKGVSGVGGVVIVGRRT